MKLNTLMLLFGLIMVNNNEAGQNQSLVQAETVVEDLGEDSKTAGEAKKQKKKKVKSTMLPAEKEKLKKDKKARKMKLESCLVITRSYYKLHEDTFTKYIDDHPAT